MRGISVEETADCLPHLEMLQVLGELRRTRLALRGLDSPAVAERVRQIRDPAVHHALCCMFLAVERLVSGPGEGISFWYPPRIEKTPAERKVERMLAKTKRGER